MIKVNRPSLRFLVPHGHVVSQVSDEVAGILKLIQLPLVFLANIVRALRIEG